MSLVRSMSSAVAGLRSEQTAMDVIGNNIANVNTAAFKSSQTNFSDIYYQSLKGASSAVNPSQVGYGSQVASINKNMTTGGSSPTDNPYDVFINGEGFLAVNTSTDGTGGTFFTRLGSLKITADGYLRDQNGNVVLGKDGTAQQPIHLVTTTTGADAYEVSLLPEGGTPTVVDSTNYSKLMNIQINPDGSISGSLDNVVGKLVFSTTTTTGTPPVTTTTAGNPLQISLATFLNPAGLTENGDSYYTANAASGAANYTTAGGTTTLDTGRLESSNVDLANEFTNMITVQRAYQANSRIITVSDSMLEELVNLKRS